MTPKEKAKEIHDKYSEVFLPIGFEAKSHLIKECALIAVDEIDLILQKRTPKDDPYANLPALEYWQQVKPEIEKL